MLMNLRGPEFFLDLNSYYCVVFASTLFGFNWNADSTGELVSRDSVCAQRYCQSSENNIELKKKKKKTVLLIINKKTPITGLFFFPFPNFFNSSLWATTISISCIIAGVAQKSKCTANQPNLRKDIHCYIYSFKIFF